MFELGRGARTLIVLAATGVLLALLHQAAPLIVPFLVAIVLATAVQPVIDALMARRVPRWLAIVVVSGGLLAAVAGFLYLVASTATDLREELPRFARQAGQLKGSLVRSLAVARLGTLARKVAGYDLGEESQHVLAGLADEAVGFLGSGLIVLFVVPFMLGEMSLLEVRLRSARESRPPGSEPLPVLPLQEIQQYLAVKTAVSVGTGIAAAVLCAACGVSAPLMWGLLAFALNYVPNFGSVAAAVPPIAIALLDQGPGVAVVVLVGFVLINVVLGYVLEPWWMGRVVGLSSFVVIVSVIIWGAILGPVGALLSVPLTVAVKLYLTRTDDLAWIARLLGD